MPSPPASSSWTTSRRGRRSGRRSAARKASTGSRRASRTPRPPDAGSRMGEAALAPSWLWILLTIGAAAAQTARNAMQRDLTGRLGTVGATHVRFLFGMPRALLLLALL